LDEEPRAAVLQGRFVLTGALSGYNGGMNTASIIVLVYAVLVLAGGVFGFLKAASRPSLIGGVVGGLALLVAAWGLGRHQSWGLPVALPLTVALLVFFSFRYVRTRAFMPGGLMAILSLLALVGEGLAGRGS